MTDSLVLLDAAGLYFRAFYSVPDSITAPDGTPVNAVRGFTDTVARIIADRSPTRLVACLDADWRPQFRVDALPSYKAHRVAEDPTEGEDVPDALGPQVPIILDVLEAAGIATAEAAGFEADDVIGTLAERERDIPVEVITGDRDLFQLVRVAPNPVSVLYLGKGWAKAETLGPAEIAAKYALPEETAGSAYADMAVLRGDPSDGLPGVPGIGEKTAAKLITEFGSLQGLLAAAAEGDTRIPKRAAASIADSADYLAAAPRVVRVVLDADIVMPRADPVPAGFADADRLDALAEKWNLANAVDRLRESLRDRQG